MPVIPDTGTVWISAGVEPEVRHRMADRGGEVVECPLLDGTTVWPEFGDPRYVVYSQPTWLGSVDGVPECADHVEVVAVAPTAPNGKMARVTTEAVATAAEFAKGATQIPGVTPAFSGDSAGWVTLLLPTIPADLVAELDRAGITAWTPRRPELPGALTVLVDHNAAAALEIVARSVVRGRSREDG